MQAFDPAHDVLKSERASLNSIFHPRNIALIGATENPGSVGRTILRNLVNNPFGGTIYPVNPKRPNVLGIKAYTDIAAVPERVDLAVIVTPARTVPGVIGQCVDAGVKSAIVISAGFKEIGAEGAALEEQIRTEAHRGGMRIIGPNCLGVMRPVTGLNATFASTLARPGSVGFISQSGALCTAILDWSLRENFGFSAFVSTGSMLDVDWGDLIDYLGDDPYTKSIVIYMESIGDARAFLSAARQVALNKPIILMKVGRTQAAAKAAASHTGALVGSDQVIDAACRRTGVLRVNSLADLFLMAEVLAKQPRPRGPRLTIVTNAGGPGVIATDSLLASEGELAELSEHTMQKFNELLPAPWSHGNPVDMLGDADPERYLKTIQIAAEDDNSDGILAILTPQAMTDPTNTAERLRAGLQDHDKPILASWMGGPEVEAGRMILNRADIPTFPYPDTAARLFSYMWRYSYNLQGLYETPTLAIDPGSAPDRPAVAQIIDEAIRTERTILSESESKQILAAYDIPTVQTLIAESEEQAVKQAEQIGFPVVLKVYSKTITHKTDVGGVQLNLADSNAVRRAYRSIEASVKARARADQFQGVSVQPMVHADGYEIIIGSSIDAQFGPVLLFGSGGQLVEVYQDRALALPPLTTTLARRMMEQTRIYKALGGVRGRKAVDLAAMEKLLVRFSQLVVEQPWIKEIDINPLLASGEQIIALDARVVLHPVDTPTEKLSYSAIRPYPLQYVTPWTTRTGLPVTIRPIQPEDEPAMVRFHEMLSDRSVYLRFFHSMHLSARVTHERLRRRCFVDYNREMALIADYKDPRTDEHLILGVGRLSRLPGGVEAEFAVTVADPYQHQGLGTQLLQRLIDIARQERITRIVADILPDNLDMQRICERVGFSLREDKQDEVVKARIDLTEPATVGQ